MRRHSKLTPFSAVAVSAVLLLSGCSDDGADVATGDGTTTTESSTTSVAPASDLHLWLSATRVPLGDVELVAILVNDGSSQPTFGVGAALDRWSGTAWKPHRHLGMCLDHWFCTARLQPLTAGLDINDIGLLAPPGGSGPVERFTIAGLAPGRYRITQEANEGDVAAGELEVVRDAPTPAPLVDVTRPAMSIHPALLPITGGTVRLSPLVPFRNGTQTAEDVHAATAGLASTVSIDRWAGSSWARVAQSVAIRTSTGDSSVEVPPLEPGAYRLVRDHPDGAHPGSFWVE